MNQPVTLRHRAVSLAVLLGLLLAMVGLSNTAIDNPVVDPVADVIQQVPVVAPAIEQVQQILSGEAALAATFMFTAWYWNCCSDARMYCNSTPAYKTGGRYCASGHLRIKYPGSSSYCYRRNTVRIIQGYDGYQSWAYSGGLYYVC